MRTRSFGSEEDEDGSKSPRPSGSRSGTSLDRTENNRLGSNSEKMTVRETSRARQSIRLQERRQGKDMTATISPSRDGSRATQWTRTTSVAGLAPERNPLAHAEVSAKRNSDSMRDDPRQQATRLRSPWRCSLLTLATSFTSVILLIAIIHSFLNRQQDPKGCAMSYMAPAFAHFSDFDTEHTRFASKYSLYLYREGGVDDDARVKGIPVLFIPGNAGSYKQVRPIGGEAARHFHDVLRMDQSAIADGKRPLDIFTVDFNEELTAFHGQTLLDQAEYLNEAVAYILALYHNPHRSLREPGLPDPKSVIILGHSMGGVVARAMLRMPNYREYSINTIVTLSAPHARPPVSFDATMVETYNNINNFWRQSYLKGPNKKNPLADVTLISIAGGGLDTMIPSEYTSLTSLVPDTHGFTVFTSSIPNVWTGMDHLAIMWCDQFRKALVRALFDVVDVRRPAQTTAQSERIRAFRKRLLTGMEPVVEKGLLDQEPPTYLALDHKSSSIVPPGGRLVLRSIRSDASTRVHIMPIPEQPFAEGSKFTLLTDQNLRAAHDSSTLSVLLCSVFPRSASLSAFTHAIHLNAEEVAGANRLACKNVASDVSLLPASTAHSHNAFDDMPPFSYVQYDLSRIVDYQFVAVVETAPETTPGWVIAEFSNASESSLKVSKGHHELLMRGLVASLPAERPMMTELKIPEIHSTLFAYNLQVNRKKCSGKEETFAPLLRQYIAEPYESKFIVNAQNGNINVHGLSPYMPPPLNGGGATEGLSLQLWTDPTCNSTVEISLRVDILGSAGKLVMRYRTVFASFPLLVVALVLRKQFKVYDTTGIFMSFTQSMDHCIRTSLPAIFLALTFFAIAISKSGSPIWSFNILNTQHISSAQSTDFAANDLILGSSDPFFWFLVPLFAIVSVGICIAMNYATLIITHLITVIYSRIHSWTSRAADDGQQSPSSRNAFGRNRRIVTTGLLVLLVITVIPYQLAYVINCVVQIATCVRALSMARETQSHQNYNFYNYTHSMLILMLWILPINMPVLLVWARNLTVQWLTPFSTHYNLLSVIGYILLVEVMSNSAMIPRAANRIRYLTNIFIFAVALYAAVYGVTYAYRMHYLVNALCMWLFFIHLSHDAALTPLAGLASYLGPSESATTKSANGVVSTKHSSHISGNGSVGRHVKKQP